MIRLLSFICVPVHELQSSCIVKVNNFLEHFTLEVVLQANNIIFLITWKN